MITSLALFLFFAEPGTVDYAEARQVDDWLHDPVVGDVSFDNFVRVPGNPIHRGSVPYDWPVNGFLFHDPVSGRDYCYAGEYASGYALTPGVPSRCVVLRAKAEGGWENLGPIFGPDPHVFEGEVSPVGHAPDVSALFADGRYHLCYDWTTQNTTWANAAAPPADANSGVGYAWADRPEGPFHQVARPLASTREQTLLLGKYRRLYASSLIKREHDWLVLTLSDSGPNFGWALLGMTAAAPEGPYTPLKPLLYPDSARYLPPLLEYFPAFNHDGYLYAPATSVARNRNYQAIFRVPIERAMEPDAWEDWQLGSVWHAEPVENESAGIWGQTFSGYVDAQQVFHVMYPSRDPANHGTINLAERPWDQPMRGRGFVISAPGAPSLALLRRGGAVENLDVSMKLKGALSVFWGGTMPIGPDRPASDSAPHAETLAHHTGLRLDGFKWSLYRIGDAGHREELHQGTFAPAETTKVEIAWKNEIMSLAINEAETWHGTLPCDNAGLGLLLETGAWAHVDTFSVTGDNAPQPLNHLYTDALCSAAQRADDWSLISSSDFRYGAGVVSKAADARAKWNIEGTGFGIWAPRGPHYGKARIDIDGRDVGDVNYHAEVPRASEVVMFQGGLLPGRHTVTLKAERGTFPVNGLTVYPAN